VLAGHLIDRPGDRWVGWGGAHHYTQAVAGVGVHLVPWLGIWMLHSWLHLSLLCWASYTRLLA
jgi:hypothetical protein